MRLVLRVVFVAVLTLAAPVALAEAPATQPATRPATSEASIREWFTQLNDTDPNVRDDARVALMGISRDDLPTLKSVVHASLPLTPAQSSVLHDIVLHVHVAGEPYAKSQAGFLGLSWTDRNAIDAPAQRLLGCPAYRLLQEGDIIKGIREARLFGDLTSQELTTALSSFSAGATIHIVVIRRGQLKEIAVTLDGRPTGLDPKMSMQLFEGERRVHAEKYWKEDFLPLLVDEVL